jgi:hypothetical protein
MKKKVYDVWFISNLVAENFYKSLPRARKERQIAPQASGGNPLSIRQIPAIRKA